MHIGIDARHLTGGNGSGVDHYTLELLRALLHLSPAHEFVLLTTGSAQAKARAEERLGTILEMEGVHHRHITIPNRVLNASAAFLRRPPLERLFEMPLDGLWLPNLNFFVPGHLPYVLTLHDLSFELFPEQYNQKRQLWHRFVYPQTLARKASRLIVPSHTTKEDAARLYGVEPTRVDRIPHGLSEAFHADPLPTDHGVRSRYDLPRHYVLHVGTHEPRKNLPFLVEGFLESLKRSPELRALEMKLVLAGAAADVTLPRSPHVRRLGYVPDAHLPALYRKADVFAFPSFYEGFGMPILEAFASGVPVITSHTSAMLEVGGPAALFIDPHNREDLVRALVAIVEDKPLRAHLIADGLERAEHYTWETAAKATMASLEKALH